MEFGADLDSCRRGDDFDVVVIQDGVSLSGRAQCALFWGDCAKDVWACFVDCAGPEDEPRGLIIRKRPAGIPIARVRQNGYDGGMIQHSPNSKVFLTLKCFSPSCPWT